MEKKPIEEFIEKHGLVLELDIRHNKVIAMLYKEDDLLITSFEDETMNGAIDRAVTDFKQKEQYESNC